MRAHLLARYCVKYIITLIRDIATGNGSEQRPLGKAPD
jgi:hypothetical protein